MEVHVYENAGHRAEGLDARRRRLWMQTSNDQHVFRQNVHTKNTDFKKFNVDVLQQISPSNCGLT